VVPLTSNVLRIYCDVHTEYIGAHTEHLWEAALSEYVTRFGSLLDFQKGLVEIIHDDPKHYAFSNIFDVANNSKAYEKVAVAQNMEYVLEVLRAEGTSGWWTASHDEFALVMDGEVDIRLVHLDTPLAAEGQNGSIRVNGQPAGRTMGRIRARRGTLALLPANRAYQFDAGQPAAILLQTIAGELTVYRWSQICITR
jgi:hypothetical protein